MNKKDNLIWIDCEFSGLNYEKDTLLEIAAIVTTRDLEIIGEPVEFIIRHTKDVLGDSNDWVKENLPELLRQSEESNITMEEAEEGILSYVKEHTEAGASPLCGNTIGSDRRMISIHMPNLHKHFHYRNIDVSTIKELGKRWYIGTEELIEKKENHRAMDDILESIEELKVYREHLFVENK